MWQVARRLFAAFATTVEITDWEWFDFMTEVIQMERGHPQFFNGTITSTQSLFKGAQGGSNVSRTKLLAVIYICPDIAYLI
jgi:hypothetical protein